MLKKMLLLLFVSSSLCAADIDGFWKTIDEDSHKARSVIAVYEYQGKHYGRIIGTFDDEGTKIKDSIYDPKELAPGVIGNPPYCGLDIIWDMEKVGNKFKGKILDPQEGDIYRAELWTENGNLVVRGKILFFGRNQTWLPFTDFTSAFKKPDVSKFVPIIPQVD